MRVRLPYGRSDFDLTLKGEWDLLLPDDPRPVHDPRQALLQSLEAPIGSPSLETLIRAKRNVTIIVSDCTRPTGASIFVPPLLEFLNATGIPDQNIRILFSLGIHGPQTPAQQQEILGPAVTSRCLAVDHDCKSADGNSYVGTTRGGIRVFLNRTAVDSEFVLATGSIGFHYLAGFSGGRKSIVPGISSYETCASWHRLSLDADGHRHPKARTAILLGNPLHEESADATRFLPPAFLINTVLTRSREIAGFFSGDLLRAHQAGCDRYEKGHVVDIDDQREAVIVACGGSPRDLNFIQAHKAIEHSCGAVKKGGVVIAVAECPQGLGSPSFLAWFDHPSRTSMAEHLQEHFDINGQTALSLRTKAESFEILLLSKLSPEAVIKMGMKPIETLGDGIRILEERFGKNVHGWVIPDAVSLLPRIGGPGGAHFPAS